VFKLFMAGPSAANVPPASRADIAHLGDAAHDTRVREGEVYLSHPSGARYRPPMPSLTIAIGNKNYSSWSLRGWLALEHIGVPYREVVIPLGRAETRALIAEHSPSGRVPALHHDDARVWDSLAIAEHLAEAFPDAHLWPDDRTARAFARRLSARACR
jgi:hypothetical protein